MRFLKKWLKSVLSIPFIVVVLARPKIQLVEGRACLYLIDKKGSGCIIEGYGLFLNRQNLTLGDHVFIGRNSFIQAAGGVSIGDYTHISRNVTIHTANHNINGELLPYDRRLIKRPISIGRYVWIGMNVNILSGVTIGDGAVIGMGATITKDVERGEIVVGAAQRMVGARDEQHTSRLESQGSFLRNM